MLKKFWIKCLWLFLDFIYQAWIGIFTASVVNVILDKKGIALIYSLGSAAFIFILGVIKAGLEILLEQKKDK